MPLFMFLKQYQHFAYPLKCLFLWNNICNKYFVLSNSVDIVSTLSYQMTYFNKHIYIYIMSKPENIPNPWVHIYDM